MPLYEYQCEACGHRFELIQHVTDPPADACPICAGRVRKLLSAPAIQFKGTGWYITDYSRKGTGRDGDAPQTDGDTSSAKTDKTTSKASGSSKDSPAADSGSGSKKADKDAAKS